MIRAQGRTHHAGQDEVNASGAPVCDAVDGTCLPGQVELQVQPMQMLKDLVGQIPDGPLHHLQHWISPYTGCIGKMH